MSRFATRSLMEDITYWAPTPGQTNDFGHAIFQSPILIKGRWEDKIQQIRKANGDEVVSVAEVYVDRELDLEGYLARGDQTGQAAPTSDASEIQAFVTVPDLRNLDHERRAFL